MTFAADLAKIPFAARGTDAAGFLAPVFRANGHILFATALAHADPPVPPSPGKTSDEEIVDELREAGEHWNVINWNQALSPATADFVTNVGAAIKSAVKECPRWAATDRKNNLRDLANRVAALGAVLDRECVGLANSDPGYQF